MNLPVERSISVSAPQSVDHCSFSTSPSILLTTSEFPILLFTFTCRGDAAFTGAHSKPSFPTVRTSAKSTSSQVILMQYRAASRSAITSEVVSSNARGTHRHCTSCIEAETASRMWKYQDSLGSALGTPRMPTQRRAGKLPTVRPQPVCHLANPATKNIQNRVSILHAIVPPRVPDCGNLTQKISNEVIAKWDITSRVTATHLEETTNNHRLQLDVTLV